MERIFWWLQQSASTRQVHDDGAASFHAARRIASAGGLEGVWFTSESLLDDGMDIRLIKQKSKQITVLQT